MAMRLTNEDLMAIKGLFDERFDNLEAKVDNLETKVDNLDARVGNLESDMAEVKSRVTKIEIVQLENYLIPKVEEIAEYQKSVYERYMADADKFETGLSDIDNLRKVTSKHSEQIEELQLKQA